MPRAPTGSAPRPRALRDGLSVLPATHDEAELSVEVYSHVGEGTAAYTPPHRHQRGQLLFLAQGTVLLETNEQLALLPPNRAAWIPAGLQHATTIERPYRYQSLYFRCEDFPALPTQLRLVQVSPLLRSLVLDVADWPAQPRLAALERHKAEVIVGELGRSRVMPLAIVVPREPRLNRLCRRLLAEPGLVASQQQLCELSGASTATVLRLFRQHTGLSYQQWRIQLRMIKSIELLESGQSPIAVALELGYQSESAFIHAFRRYFGSPPRAYLRRAAAGA